jgi:hypothetical protein
MANCDEMKEGQVYVCPGCGLELRVVKACEECGGDSPSCTCTADCEIACCGKPLALKK